MVRKRLFLNGNTWYFMLSLACIFSLIVNTKTHLQAANTTLEKVCQSTNVQYSISLFSQLKGCTVIEGFIQIVLIDTSKADYSNISFPELREITGYLLFYRVKGLRSLGQIFPNLTVIRGNSLFFNYALLIFEMLDLQEIGLVSLTNILRGAVIIAKNPILCFARTVDWNMIAIQGKENHYIMGNKHQNECPMCPSSKYSCPVSNIHGGKLCWNSHYCQKVCPDSCNGSCRSNGECCLRSCLGGCLDTYNSNQCSICRHFRFQEKCVKKCPIGTYEYKNHRCVLEAECYNMAIPHEIDNFSNRNSSWKTFEGKCISKCPSNYLEVFNVTSRRYICEACEGICRKECPGINVDSIASAQKLNGCTIVRGALEIQIRGGNNVVKELEGNLNMIEEIDDYLKIVRSFPIVSLNFLRNLRFIHGKYLENSKYVVVILDNQNLVELWDWSKVKKIHIGNGKLFFHFNSKLCLSKIEKLREVAGLSYYTEQEVASYSNGDKIACNVKTLNATVSSKNSYAALIKWSEFKHYDSRTLLGYVVYSIEAPFKNITIYDKRDACGGDGWRADDISVSDGFSNDGELIHILTRLKPFTQYAFYVKTYTIATEQSGAQSNIQYFTTDPDTPSEPQALTAFSNSSSEIVINWQPPANPNGNVTHYIVTGHLENDKEFIEQRNYCKQPIYRFDPKIILKKTVKADQKSDKKVIDEGSEVCVCKQKVPEMNEREREIHLEDHLQNEMYYKRVLNSREKRDLFQKEGKLSKAKLLDKSGVSESYSFVNGEHFMNIVNSNSVVIKNLKHFSQYNIAVRACRTWELEENTTQNNNCSVEAITTARTLPLVGADNIGSQYPMWEISNESIGEVILTWNEPTNPNSIILTYEIEYKKLNIDNYKPTVECTTRKEFVNSGNVYHLKKLGPGNYSLRIRASSLAGHGAYTPYTYFVIEEDSSFATFYIVSTVSVIFLGILVIVITMLFLRRKYTNVQLTASVNPDYVPTVYIPDEWEVPQNQVELLGEIGQGAFGMVYEGRIYDNRDSLVKPCAVKTVNLHAAERDRIEFLNEASVMKRFNTHHIVKLLGVVSQGQPILVVMELMKYGDLKSYLRSHRPDASDNPNANHLSIKRILRMAIEIADGMAYLAAKKIVHCDLAARNCMVSEDLTVKIGDFGMARDIYETEYYQKGSKGLLPIRWMAPESIKDGIFTSHSDSWSYGVVLYEMATLASQPYQGLSNDQVLRYVTNGGIMERPENCPDKLYSIMRLCWEQKPHNRPSFVELVDLLQNDVEEDFRTVSFCYNAEGREYCI
uniref:Insulin-like receptor n=1 Tax=Pyrrhocoris apterus TaxID=37000 RepID=A0A6F7ZNF1_PYRAP|nr:insulin receptor 1b [Pyrrhocoris apterus]QIS94310.1 insulin receptor 1b [Pyrrhocoris apterus]